MQVITFDNGFILKLACKGGKFLGIGDVRYGGTRLRNAECPWTFYTESERGFRFDSFRLVDVQSSGSEATIVFESQGAWLPRVQEADAMGDARVRTRRLSGPTATFRWHFRAVTERIHENEWTGLAMQISVESPGHPIHWLIEDTTWEIGGAAEGCTLIQQDVSSIDLEQSVKADSTFSTIERFVTEQDQARQETGVWGGSFPMDMLPRCAGASPLDFQVKGSLALCLFAEKPSLTRARIEKVKDENVIHHTDRPFFPLTEHAQAPERKLLLYRHAPAGKPKLLKRHEWRNLWLDCFTEVRRRIHANYGFAAEVPRPQLWAHLWNHELSIYGPHWLEPLQRALPEYKRLGYHDVFTHGVWVGTSNDPARTDKNICCNYEYRYAPEFGGPEGMRRLCDAAHSLGIRIWQWFGMQFDKQSPLWKDHPDWVLREANGDPWDGAYQILQCGRFRSGSDGQGGYCKHLLDLIRKVKEDTGLDAIFWDSYQNLGVTCVDWQAPDKAPQAEEIWRFQAELQKLGFSQRCEVVTIFGITNVSMYGFDNDPKASTWGSSPIRRRAWRTAVNNDEAFAWLDCSPAFFSDDPFTADKLGPAQYFWLLGHRCVPVLPARPWGPKFDGKPLPGGGPQLPGGPLAEEYARVNLLYNAALPHMHRLRVTEGGKYTLWLDQNNQKSVVWAFRDAAMKYAGSVTILGSGEVIEVKDTLHLRAGNVYRLRK